MLAEALASGLAREARRTERPPPDNFYLLPRDPNAWRQIQTACKKENMVIAVEITDNINENCRRVQSLFVDMAREFDSIPFLRAQIGLGNTFEEVSVAIGFVDSCVFVMNCAGIPCVGRDLRARQGVVT